MIMTRQLANSLLMAISNADKLKSTIRRFGIKLKQYEIDLINC